MKQVYADSEIRLKSEHPRSFCRQRHYNGMWSGLVRDEDIPKKIVSVKEYLLKKQNGG